MLPLLHFAFLYKSLVYNKIAITFFLAALFLPLCMLLLAAAEDGPTRIVRVMRDQDTFSRVMRDTDHFNRVMKDPGHFNQVMRDPAHFNSVIRVIRDPGHFIKVMRDQDHFNRVMRNPGHFNRVMRDPGHFNRVMRNPGHFNRVMRNPDHFNRVMREQGHFNRLMRDPNLASINRGDPMNSDRALWRIVEKINIDPDQRNIQKVEDSQTENQGEVLHDTNGNPAGKLVANMVTSASTAKASPKWFMRFLRDQPQPRNALARLM